VNHSEGKPWNDRDGVPTLAPDAASPGVAGAGVQVGNFQLQTLLGRGGMGEVWKAWDTKAERPVVLKLVPRELQRAAEEMARVRDTFRRVHALQHQHICPLYLLDEDPQFGWYLVMKFIDGQTLSSYRATYAARHGSFPVEQLVKVLLPVAAALDYAHGEKVIHRDIKPQNILVVGEASDVQVVDFGLAAEIRTTVSRYTRIQMDTSGTRPYMAPEQWRGQFQDARTDQYALAVVAYELLAGRLPFESADFDILRACVLNDPPEGIEGQPDWVNRALLVGLGKRRDERFESCVGLVRAIERGEGLSGSVARPPEPTAKVRVVTRAHATPAATAERLRLLTNSIGMKLTLIPPGEFLMGSSVSAEEIDRRFPGGKVEWYEDEHPQHLVRLTRPFYLGMHQVTVSDLRRFVDATGYKDREWSDIKGLSWKTTGFDQQETHPVTCVSWDDAMAFCDWLSREEGRTYRLPTEAEWEYACRAGSTTLWCFGDDESSLGEYAWYGANSEGKTHPVAEKKPNAWGLYDMYGNVWEWCSDWYGAYQSTAVDDPTGAGAGLLRVDRGGGWGSDARGCRSADRHVGTPGDRSDYLGFRVASGSVDGTSQ